VPTGPPRKKPKTASRGRMTGNAVTTTGGGAALRQGRGRGGDCGRGAAAGGRAEQDFTGRASERERQREVALSLGMTAATEEVVADLQRQTQKAIAAGGFSPGEHPPRRRGPTRRSRH